MTSPSPPSSDPVGASPSPPESPPRTTDIGVNHLVCPHCQTANRLTRQTCVQCDRDLSMLRLAANKAKHHFNVALEHAERSRWSEAVGELRHCLDMDANHVNAWVVLGTCLAKLERFDEAREAWQRSLAIDPRFAKAHDYLDRVARVPEARFYYRRLRRVSYLLLAVLVIVAGQLYFQWRPAPLLGDLRSAQEAFLTGNHGDAQAILTEVMEASPPPHILDSARALLTATHALFDSAQREIVSARREGDWRHGLEACARLRALRPTPTLERLAAIHETEFATRLVAESDALVGALARGAATQEEVLAALTDLPSLMPTSAMRSEVEALVARAEMLPTVSVSTSTSTTSPTVLTPRDAVALFERFLESDREYENRWIDLDLARETVAHWETLIERVPDARYGRRFRTDHCLFYAASAWEVLGEPARAIALYERTVAEFPERGHRALAEERLRRLVGEGAD